ncbi:MAG TPA: hypothetical protein VFB43_01870 [Terracidiphilus sp.]|nr:hypothetical protein [Terracidiphilus sp.]
MNSPGPDPCPDPDPDGDPGPCPEEIGAALGAVGGAEARGGALGVDAAGALAASGEFMARNICVKLPESLDPCAAAGGAGAGSAGLAADTAGNAGGVFSAAEIFSIGTGLKTLASSSEGRETGSAFAGSVVFSACSIRVNSPCDGGAGVGAGAALIAAGAGDGVADGGGAAAGGSFGTFASNANRSSSLRAGGAATVPKIPVALDWPPAAAPSLEGSEGGV